MLIALDPGTRSPGIASFSELGPGSLLKADRVRVDDLAHLPDGQRWMLVARRLLAWCKEYVPVKEGDPVRVVFERPQWYTRAKSKGDPNGLAGLTGVAGNLTGMLSFYCNPNLEVVSPKPAEWIGQISKTCKKCGENKKSCTTCRGSAWETPRGRFIRKRLQGYEMTLVPDQNDAIDAVGLGLWALGRLEPHRVLSNGRDGR